jgi:hypothetical protein
MPRDHQGQAMELTKSARLHQAAEWARLGCRVGWRAACGWGRAYQHRGVRNLAGIPDDHSGGVRQSLRHSAPVPAGAAGDGAGRTPTMLTGRPVACGSSGPDRFGYAGHELPTHGVCGKEYPCPHWWSADERWSDIRPEHQIAEDTSMVTDTSVATCAGHQLSGLRLFRKQQRTVNPPIVPARYNVLYLSSRLREGCWTGWPVSDLRG